MAPNIDVYIIPDMKQTGHYHPKRNHGKKQTNWKKTVLDLLMITGIMLLATWIAWIFQIFDFSEANTIMIYLLGVLFSAYLANQTICTLYSALISVLLFNFFFTEPLYSLKAYDKIYTTTFLMLFVVGLFTGTLTWKLKKQNLESAKKAYRTEILLENSQKLRRCKSKKAIWEQVAGQCQKLLNLSLLIYPVDQNGVLGCPVLFPRKGMEQKQMENLVNTQGKRRSSVGRFQPSPGRSMYSYITGCHGNVSSHPG